MFVNQSLQRPVGVNVFGSCLIRAEPDYASLRFSVNRVAEKPADSLAQTRQAVRDVRRVLGDGGVRAEDIRTSRVQLQLAFSGYGAERHSIGYRADIDFLVLLHDLGTVEDLLVAVVEAGAHEIRSVSYKTSRLLEIRADARSGAVRAARAKAEVYARAAGLEVGKALHIEDVNPEQLAGQSHRPDIDLTEHDESGGGGAAGPGSIVVAGAVMACFALVG